MLLWFSKFLGISVPNIDVCLNINNRVVESGSMGAVVDPWMANKIFKVGREMNDKWCSIDDDTSSGK